jgi:NTE family protein
MTTTTTKVTNMPTSARPRLALVLGSGGVRSAAALGIADVLQGAGISPDLIVGCSSGALYGAAIAMGMSRTTALTLWSSELTEQRRWRAYAELLAPRLFGFGAHFSLRDAGRISERIRHGFGDWQLESLPTPMRIVTTDATTGESVVLTRGSLADALYASVALPFVFPSIRIGGRRLADGVLSNPLPISVASDARAVITLGFRGVMPRRIDRPGRLLAQVTTTMINNLQQAHVQAAQAAGQRVLGLELDLDARIGLWQASAIPRIYEAGRRAAHLRLAEIVALLDESSARAA